MTYPIHNAELPEKVEIYTNNLLSKWGFNDGNPFEWLCDHGKFDEHKVLIEVIKNKVIPLLDQKVEVVICTGCHNPIRAEKVNGIDVSDTWCDTKAKDILTPSVITITGQEILDIAKQLHP